MATDRPRDSKAVQKAASRDFIIQAFKAESPQEEPNPDGVRSFADVFHGVGIKKEVALKLHGRLCATLGVPRVKRENLISHSTEAVIHSRQLVDFIRPRIEALRLEVFGSKEAPFKSVKDVWEWIRSETAGSTPPTEEEQRQALALYRKAVQTMSKAAELIHSRFAPPAFQRHSLQYRETSSDDSWVVTAPSRPGSNLERVAVLTKELRDVCWISQVTIADFFFRDEPLAVPFAVVPGKLEGSQDGHVRQTPLTVIYNRPLTGKELASVTKRLYELWGIKRKRPLADDADEFLQLVESCGKTDNVNPRDLPHGKGIPFWTRVLRKWQKRHPGQLTNWESARKKYFRLQKQMSPR